MAVSEGELLELVQNGTVLVTDDRTTGAKTWITNGIQRREIADAAERQTMQEILGLPVGTPPVKSWLILQRIPLV